MKNTLKKALDELNKDNPRLDYVRGILEVVIDQYQDTPVYTPQIPNYNLPIHSPTQPIVTESLPALSGEPIIRSRKNVVL